MRRIALLPLLASAACFSQAPTDVDGSFSVTRGTVEYRVSTAIMESFPVQLATQVRLTNRGFSPVRVLFPDGCVVLLRAAPASNPDKISWDQGHTVGCTDAIVQVQLAPGAAREFETRTDARKILGDSLPDGNYILQAYLRPENSQLIINAGTVPLAIPR